jgi:hypothetical protein
MIHAATRMTLIAALALILGIASSAAAKGKPQDVPPQLEPPASAVLLVELGARGVQIYACEAKPETPTTFAWTFKAPEADLLNARGEVVGSHFAGPTWEAHDGSAVGAAAAARADAPNPKKAIPWLLLEARSHEGNGVFSTVTHIQRLDTVGGVAPAKGCDADHAGEVRRVPYKATYAFFYPVDPAA